MIQSYKFALPGEGGGATGPTQDILLNDHGDFVLQSPGGIGRLQNSDGDFVLQSPNTCRNRLLNDSGGHILNSNGSALLDGNNCTSNILNTGNKITSKI